MEDEIGLSYEDWATNKRGSHPETGGSEATMDDDRPTRRTIPPSSRQYGFIPARKSILTGDELKRALRHLGVSKRSLARHAGVHEITVNKFTSGKSDGDIPLWVEWMLWIYDEIPWSRRLRGRHKLPLRRWGIDRDDPDPEAQGYGDVMERAVRTESWTRARMVRRLERAMHDILNDPDASDRSKQIAARSIQDLKRHATTIDYDISERSQALRTQDEYDESSDEEDEDVAEGPHSPDGEVA